MRRSRIGIGLLATVLLAVVLFVALREAGEFERISGVARTERAATEPTLGGTSTESEPPAVVVERNLDPGAADAAGAVPGRWEIRARVVDFDHRPVAGVPIRIPGRTQISDAEGRVTFSTEEAFVHLVAQGDWEGVAAATRTRPEPVLQVVPVLPLSIRVVDGTGRPVSGVSGTGSHSYTSSKDPGNGGGHTLSFGDVRFGPTDEEGRCQLRLAVTTDGLRLEVSHADTHAREIVWFPFQREVVLPLRPRLRISCVIVDAAGNRLAPDGGLVARPVDRTRRIIRSREGSWFVEHSFTDFVETEGEEAPDEATETPPPQILLDVSDAGPWHMHFEPDAPGLAASDPVLVTAPANDVRLACRPAVSIRGRVVAPGNTTFHVRWLPAPTSTGGRRKGAAARAEPDGTFHVYGLAPGAGRLYARSATDDRYGLLENAEAPLEGVQIRLQEGVPLVGRIADYRSPTGLNGALLEVLARDGALFASADVHAPGGLLDDARPENFFVLRGLPPGRYELLWRWRSAWGASSGRWQPFGVEVDLGPETEELVLPCPR